MTTNNGNSSNLDSLLDTVLAGQFDDDAMTSLPTFGGDEPASTHGVWSWDATRLLVSVNDARRFAIIDRDDA